MPESVWLVAKVILIIFGFWAFWDIYQGFISSFEKKFERSYFHKPLLGSVLAFFICFFIGQMSENYALLWTIAIPATVYSAQYFYYIHKYGFLWGTGITLFHIPFTILCCFTLFGLFGIVNLFGGRNSNI